MKHFTYSYEGRERQADYVENPKNAHGKYTVNTDADEIFAMSKFSFDTKIWIQAVYEGDIVFAHDYIQAVGEGLDKMLNTV